MHEATAVRCITGPLADRRSRSGSGGRGGAWRLLDHQLQFGDEWTHAVDLATQDREEFGRRRPDRSRAQPDGARDLVPLR